MLVYRLSLNGLPNRMELTVGIASFYLITVRSLWITSLLRVSSVQHWSWCDLLSSLCMHANYPAPSKNVFFFKSHALYSLFCVRSRAEVPGVRRNLLWEFNFGVQYAWTLLNFSLVTMYSVSCPLITPFGMEIFAPTLLFVIRKRVTQHT